MRELFFILLLTSIAAFADDGEPRDGLPSDEDYFEAIRIADHHIDAENYQEALPWLEKSASYGDKTSQHMLAIFYLNGHGTDVDYAKAYAWAAVAAESGNRRSQKLRDHVGLLFNEQQLQVAERFGSQFIDKYGMDARDIYCKKKKQRNSHISSTVCSRKHLRNSRYQRPIRSIHQGG